MAKLCLTSLNLGLVVHIHCSAHLFLLPLQQRDPSVHLVFLWAAVMASKCKMNGYVAKEII